MPRTACGTTSSTYFAKTLPWRTTTIGIGSSPTRKTLLTIELVSNVKPDATQYANLIGGAASHFLKTGDSSRTGKGWSYNLDSLHDDWAHKEITPLHSRLVEMKSHRTGQRILIDRPDAKYMYRERRVLIGRLVEEAETILRVTSDSVKVLIESANSGKGPTGEAERLADALRTALHGLGVRQSEPDFRSQLLVIRDVLDRALDWFTAADLKIGKMPKDEKKAVWGLAYRPADGWWLPTPGDLSPRNCRRGTVATKKNILDLANWKRDSFGPWASRIAPTAHGGFETTQPQTPERYSGIRMRMSQHRIEESNYEQLFGTLVHEITHATSATTDIVYSDDSSPFYQLSPEEHLGNADSYARILRNMRTAVINQLEDSGREVPYLRH